MGVHTGAATVYVQNFGLDNVALGHRNPSLRGRPLEEFIVSVRLVGILALGAPYLGPEKERAMKMTDDLVESPQCQALERQPATNS